MLSVSLRFRNYYLNLSNGLLLVNVTRLLIYLLFMMRNCFLVCVSGLITAYIICCQVNATLDIILGIEDILISWFLIILVVLDVALLSVCCLIHCKHLRLSDINKHTYLLTYLLYCDHPFYYTLSRCVTSTWSSSSSLSPAHQNDQWLNRGPEHHHHHHELSLISDQWLTAGY